MKINRSEPKSNQFWRQYFNMPNFRSFLLCVFTKMFLNHKLGLHQSQNVAKMRKFNRRWPKSNQLCRYSIYIGMSNFCPFKGTAIKTPARNQLYLRCCYTTKWKCTIEKFDPKRKLQIWPNPKLMLSKPSRGIIMENSNHVNHLEVSS